MKRTLCLLLLSIITFIMCSCRAEDKMEEKVYSELIEQVKEGLKNDFQTVYPEDLNISDVFYYGQKNLGFCVMDLDADGVDELMFGENHEGEGNNIIYDIYTIQDGEMIRVIEGWERNRFYLCDNGVIANEVASGASNFYYAYYTYQHANLELSEAVIYDGERNVQQPWFYSSEAIVSEFANPIHENEATEIINSYKYIDIEFIPFLSE